MKRNKKILRIILDTALFFLFISAVLTIAVTVYFVVASKTDSKTFMAVIMLLTVLFLSIATTTVYLARRNEIVSKPAEEILSATDRIASGDFSVRLNIEHEYKRYNEYDRIKENLNKMVAELAKTEVLHNDFVSNVSHELKTPLAVIKGYAAALQADDLDEDTRKKYAQTLASAAERLSALVTNILKLNKLESQQLTPEYETFRLDEMIAVELLSYEDIIESKNITVECDLDEVTITSCPDYLKIVWNNLISNAIKFTDDGGAISLSLKCTNGRTVVKVADNGCGISKETGERIFDKFYQGDTSHSKEGNGLGLALVKKVIDVIGGEIAVESEVGKGSVFTVTLTS